MNAARALEIEGEFHKEISGRFYSDPAKYENGQDRLAYEAVKAIQRYRQYLLKEEVRQRKELEDDHYICDVCGAHLDRDEKCGCKKTAHELAPHTPDIRLNTDLKLINSIPYSAGKVKENGEKPPFFITC